MYSYQFFKNFYLIYMWIVSIIESRTPQGLCVFGKSAHVELCHSYFVYTIGLEYIAPSIEKGIFYSVLVSFNWNLHNLGFIVAKIN